MPILQCKMRTEDTIWSNQQGSHNIKPCKKIIASTDESLGINPEKLNDFIYLPRLSNEFLQAYCKANGKLDEVLVELNHPHDECKINWENSTMQLTVKVAPDNTITIKPLGDTVTVSRKLWQKLNSSKEKMYNREEIIDRMKCAYNKGMEVGETHRNPSLFDRNKWIEENL